MAAEGAQRSQPKTDLQQTRLYLWWQIYPVPTGCQLRLLQHDTLPQVHGSDPSVGAPSSLQSAATRGQNLTRHFRCSLNNFLRYCSLLAPSPRMRFPYDDATHWPINHGIVTGRCSSLGSPSNSRPITWTLSQQGGGGGGIPTKDLEAPATTFPPLGLICSDWKPLRLHDNVNQIQVIS